MQTLQYFQTKLKYTGSSVDNWQTHSLCVQDHGKNLKNIDDVILRESDPKLGTPIYLNLSNRGIRSIEYSSAHQMYFIIAGSISGEGNSSIYSWSGSIKTNPKTIMTFSPPFQGPWKLSFPNEFWL